MNDLLAATVELVALPSVSRQERLIADHVEAKLRSAEWLEVARVADNIVARTALGHARRVVLAGHLDTVPPAGGNDVPRVEGGTLWGLGSADMKGGLAVMIDLATTVPEPALDVTYVFYAAEEVAREHSGLLVVEKARPDLLVGDAAVVCEPTGCLVEAGCQGVLKVRVTLAGRRAHVARPAAGRNAVHRLGPLLCWLQSWQARAVDVEGCTYVESLQAVDVSGGVASNVVPDRAELMLNYRFAPDLDLRSATASLREVVSPWLEAEDGWEVVDSAPPARPFLDHPLLAGLVSAAGGRVRAKLGWTDVAFFAEREVPAANFGPGDPEVAHTPGGSRGDSVIAQHRLQLPVTLPRFEPPDHQYARKEELPALEGPTSRGTNGHGPRRHHTAADLLAVLGVDHGYARIQDDALAEHRTLPHPRALRNHATAPDQRVVTHHHRCCVGRLQHTSDAHATGQVDPRSDLCARPHRRPGVHHGVGTHPGTDVHVAGHEDDAPIQEGPPPSGGPGNHPHPLRVVARLERQPVRVLERTDLGGRHSSQPEQEQDRLLQPRVHDHFPVAVQLGHARLTGLEQLHGLCHEFQRVHVGRRELVCSGPQLPYL